jgi:hypothetical protein
MNVAELKKRLPPRTLFTLAAGGLLALGFVAVFLIPQYREAERLRLDIAAARSSLGMRRQLEPVALAIKQLEAAIPTVAKVGDGKPLPLAEVGRLTTVFDDMATSLGLSVSSVSPDASSVAKGGLLAVRVGLVGEATAFREFLLSLGSYGPLTSIESASSMMGRDGREYAVKFWLAVQ